MNNSFKKKLNIDYILKNYFYLIILFLIPSVLMTGFFYLVFPNYESMKIDLESTIYSEQKYGELKTSQIEKLDSYESAFKKINQKNIEKIYLALPENRDITNIISEINKISENVGVDIENIFFEDDEQTNKDNDTDIRKINFSLDITNGGDYKKFKLLLSEIESNIRLFDIESFYITNDFNKYKLNINCYYKKI